MAEKFRIETGWITLEVNDAGETISFNPNDAKLALAVSGLIDGFEKKLKEVKELEDRLNAKPEKEMAPSLSESATALMELCKWCEGEIDNIFGEETCRKVFNGDHVLEAYGLFFEAIMPYIKKGREKVLAKYKKPAKK